MKGRAFALDADDGSIMFGGQLRAAGAVPRANLAAVDLSDGSVLSFDPQVGGFSASASVLALELVGADLYVGGDFSWVGGEVRRRLAVVDPVTGRLRPRLAAEPDDTVLALQRSDGQLLVGGRFSALGGTPRSGLAGLDVLLRLPTPFAPASCGVLALAVTPGTVHAAQCESTGGLGAFDPTLGAEVDRFGIVTGGPVTDIVDDGSGGIWAAGQFGRVRKNGEDVVERDGLLHLDADGSLAPERLTLGGGRPTVVERMGEYLVLGGGFDAVDGQPRRGAAIVRPADGDLLPFDPAGFGREVESGPDGTLYVGGGFTSFAAGTHHGLAAFRPAGDGEPPRAIRTPDLRGPDYVGGSSDGRQPGVQATDGGDFSGYPTRLSYRWLRCDAEGEDCEELDHRQPDRVLEDADIGHRMRVDVTALNDHGTTTVRSEPGPLVRGRLSRNVVIPEVSGDLWVDATLTASPGTWSPEPPGFAYQWLVCRVDSPCEPIEGETERTMRVAEDLRGERLAVEVRALGELGGVAPADRRRADRFRVPVATLRREWLGLRGLGRIR